MLIEFESKHIGKNIFSQLTIEMHVIPSFIFLEKKIDIGVVQDFFPGMPKVVLKHWLNCFIGSGGGASLCANDIWTHVSVMQTLTKALLS